MDRIHQHDPHKLGRGRGYDGGGRFFHRKRLPGCHPAEDGTLMFHLTKGNIEPCYSYPI